MGNIGLAPVADGICPNGIIPLPPMWGMFANGILGMPMPWPMNGIIGGIIGICEGVRVG